MRSLKQHSQKLEHEVTERTHELAESNRQLQIAREKAEVANQAKSVFLANMSHPETLNGNILIVDDQLPNLRLLVSILTEHG